MTGGVEALTSALTIGQSSYEARAGFRAAHWFRSSHLPARTCCLHVDFLNSSFVSHTYTMLRAFGVLVPTPAHLRLASADAAPLRTAIYAARRCRACALMARALHVEATEPLAAATEEPDPAVANLAAFLTGRSRQTLDAGLHIVPTPIGNSAQQLPVTP